MEKRVYFFKSQKNIVINDTLYLYDIGRVSIKEQSRHSSDQVLQVANRVYSENLDKQYLCVRTPYRVRNGSVG